MATVEVVSAASALHEEKIEETNKPQDIVKEDAVVPLLDEAPELEETKDNQAVAEPEAGEEDVAPEVEALATEVEAKASVADEPAHEVTPEVVPVVINAKVAPEPEPVVDVAEEANEETQDPKDEVVPEEEVKPKEAEEKIIDEAVTAEKADE